MSGFFQGSGLQPFGLTSTTVLGLPTVWRCVDVLANGVSQLQWAEHRGTLDLPLSRLARRPSAEYTRREWTSLVVRTMALFDTCYLLKVGGVDSEGVPMGLWPLAPQLIRPLYIDYSSYLPPDWYMVGKTKVSADEIVVLRRGPMPGIPDSLQGVLNVARATLGAALAAENYASRFWQAGGSPTTVLETDANLSPMQAQDVQNLWAQKRALGPDHPAVLVAGLKAKPFGADPTLQAAVEARNALAADIARYFGVPSRLANVPSNDSQTYKTAQEENLDLLRYSLQNYIGAITDAISDLLPGSREVAMLDSPLTAGTQLSRAQSWQLALGNKPWISVEEVREAEGLPPQEMPDMAADMAEEDSNKPMPGQVPADEAAISGMTGRPQ